MAESIKELAEGNTYGVLQQEIFLEFFIENFSFLFVDF